MVPELCFCQKVTDFGEWSSNSGEWSSNSDDWSSNSEMTGHQIQMTGHRNQKHIGRNNHLQTLFNNHCYIMSTWNNVHQNAITSKHYMTLSKKLQAKPSQECEREKRTG